MKYTSMILAVLLAASFMAVSAGAFQIEELDGRITDTSGNVHMFHIILVNHEELPHHSELSPFFRENDLIESDEEDDIPETVKDWFDTADNIITADDNLSFKNSVPENSGV